jgi:hypothetical protein
MEPLRDGSHRSPLREDQKRHVDGSGLVGPCYRPRYESVPFEPPSGSYSRLVTI